MIDVVNVVGSGSIRKELDLDTLASDIGKPLARYEHDKYPGMYLRFDDNGPVITLYRTGKFNITGASSSVELRELKTRFLEFLAEFGILELPIDDRFYVQNMVCVSEIDGVDGLDLNAASIGLGLEKTEYEPEQFPGLIYRPEGSNCVCLLFSSGKVVITGSRSEVEAEEAINNLNRRLTE